MSKRKALTAMAALMATIALTAAPASAQSLKSWERHNDATWCRLSHKIAADGKAKNPSLNRIQKDLEAVYRFGEKNPPSGADHKPFLRVINDFGLAIADIKSRDEAGFDTAMNNAQNDGNNLPQYIPAPC